MKLVFATNNAHKLDEVRRILPQDVEVVSLQEIGFLDEIDETGTTLEENSRIKAEAIWEYIISHQNNLPLKGANVDGVFADDTGLEIAALSGAPGVYTARWAGEPSDSARNRAKALRELKGKTNREAQFRTVVTLIRGCKENISGQAIQVEGIVRGSIATSERGDSGFGYDPLFIPEGYTKTFAELPAETKNSISHRARAMTALKNILHLT